MSQSLLDRIQVQTPCQTDWHSMRGDERVRHCAQCNKHVYNLSQMTRAQAEALLKRTNGKLCARFERRADGSILTAEATSSRWRLNPRFLRVASATISAALSLSPSVAAKTPRNLPVLQQQDKKQTPANNPQEPVAQISGQVVDATSAAIPNAKVTVTNEITHQSWSTMSATNGAYKFLLPLGENYTLTVESLGFKKSAHTGLNLKSDTLLNFNVTMEVGAIMGDIVTIFPPIPTEDVDRQLELEINKRQKFDENVSPVPKKQPKKTLLELLLVPIKKITGNDREKE